VPCSARPTGVTPGGRGRGHSPMPEWSEPGRRWRLLVPAGATVLDAGAAVPADLPSGGTVVLAGAAPPRPRARPGVRSGRRGRVPRAAVAVGRRRAHPGRRAALDRPGRADRPARRHPAPGRLVGGDRGGPGVPGAARVVARDRVVVGRQR
jgi:hypothetical protein